MCTPVEYIIIFDFNDIGIIIISVRLIFYISNKTKRRDVEKNVRDSTFVSTSTIFFEIQGDQSCRFKKIKNCLVYEHSPLGITRIKISIVFPRFQGF